jgi:hypothetical protein
MSALSDLQLIKNVLDTGIFNIRPNGPHSTRHFETFLVTGPILRQCSVFRTFTSNTLKINVNVILHPCPVNKKKVFLTGISVRSEKMMRD